MESIENRSYKESVIPKDHKGPYRANIGKMRYSLLPFIAIREIVKVLEFGATKYKEGNWLKKPGFKYSNFINSYTRHFELWLFGEDNDKESGIHHAAHMAINSIFLLTYVLTGIGEDDRADMRGDPVDE